METKNPKVSVVVPVYNAEKYIKRCMDSIINQSFNDIEIIAINDGSSDNSLNILREYEKNDKRIKVIDQENLGVSSCRNKGIKVSKGNYLVFIDSDDWIDLDMIGLMYQNSINNKSDIVICSYIREFIGHSKEKLFNLPEEVIYEKMKIRNELHRKLFGPIDIELSNPEGLDALGTVWGKLYNSELIKENQIEFVDLNIIGSNEDSFFNINVFKYVNKITFLNKPLYHYWKENSESLTSKYNPLLREQWNVLYEYMYKFIEENNYDDTYYNALQNRICINVLGLGLNECSSANKSSVIKKIGNIKSILNDKLIKDAYKNFKTENFPIHWRVFYIFNKKRLVVPSYIMLSIIEFLRTRI